MKKILLFLSFLLMSIGVWGVDAIAFSETFASCTGTFGWSENAGNGTFIPDNEGWTVENAYGAGSSAKFGATRKLGTAQTPTINCGSSTTATLTFKAGAWNGSSESTNLKLGFTGCSGDKNSVTLAKGSFTTYTVTLSGISGNIKIQFSGNATNNSRFLLDDITVRYSSTPTPVIKHTAFWLANGDTIYKDTIEHNSMVDSIPYVDIDNYCDDIFFGWTNSSYNGTTPPDVLFTTSKPTITQDTTFYAVFGSIPIYTKTNINDIDSGEIIIIVGKKDGIYYAMSNNNGTSNPPDALIVTPSNNCISPTNNILWILGKNNNEYTFYSYSDDTKWLYCNTKASSSSNNNLRVGNNKGDSERNIFILDNGYLKTNDDYTDRYIGIYLDNPDWRAYTSTSGNISGQIFEFYKCSFISNEYHTLTNCIREFNDNENDGLWTTKENWTNGKLPTIKYTAQINKPVTIDIDHAVAKNIVINQNTGTGKITIQSNNGLEVDSTIVVYKNGEYKSTTPNDLILESSDAGNASLIFNNKNNNQATVCLYSKSYIDRDKNKWHWQYMGAAMTSLNALYNYYGSWVYRWDGEEQTWIAVPNGGTMNAWTGYCITQETNEWYTTTGTLIKTDELDTILTVPVGKDMVFANSWTAPIHISKLVESGFEMTPMNVYLFNTGYAPQSEGGSSEYTGEGEEAGTHIVIPIHAAPYLKDTLIASQQGFFVSNVGGADDGFIRLNYKALVRGSDSIVAGPMRAPKRNLESVGKPDVMKIYANGSLYRDNVVILEREDFSTGFDNGWDGNKSSFGTLSPSIYVVNKNGTYDAVSAIPEFEGTVLGFRPGNDSIYTLKFEYNGGRTLYLNDMVTLESTLIDNDSKYVFASNGSEERFIISSISYSDVTTELNNIKTNLIKKLIINGNGYIIRNGLIFNILGQSIK